MNSLFAICSARLAHRLVNMDADTTNVASHLFKQHLLRPPHPDNRFHPFNTIWNNISNTFGMLPNNQDDVDRFKALTKKQLVNITWSHQYRKWWNSIPDQNGKKGSTPPALRQCYPLQNPPPSMKVPDYLHRDHPSIAARRARLRFGRALLLSFLHQRGFADAPSQYCQNCHTGRQIEETVTHVITTCQHYARGMPTRTRDSDARRST